MLVSFFRSIKLAFQNFARNFWLSLVTLTIIILSLISINILILLNIFTNTAINNVKEKIDISIYLKPNITDDQSYAIKSKIESFEQVEEVTYISAEQSLENFKKRHLTDDVLLESIEELDDNPLGITLIIKAKNTNNYSQILSKIEGKDFTEYSNWIADKDFNNYKLIIEKLNSASDKIRTVGYAASGILLLITLLIIFNSIRVAIYTHHEEIEIMRLVGATSKFISGPFFAESILYALISWLIVVIITYACLNLAQPYISSFIGVASDFSIVEYYKTNFFTIFGWQLILVVVLSIISASIAIRKYLRT